MGVPADRGYTTCIDLGRGNATLSGKLIATLATIFGFILLVYSFIVASVKIGCSLSAKILNPKVALSPYR